MIKSIEQFDYKSPLDYPGLRNDSNYMLVNGTEICDLPDDPNEAFEAIDELLAIKDLPLLVDRVPVLAFGRNASPSGAATKTEKYNHGTISAEDLGTVPMLQGTLAGHDVLWHGRPGQKGGYFAELAATNDTADTSVEVWVQFLTTEQLATIHITEGSTYELSEVSGVSLGNGVVIDTAGYTAREASLLLDEVGQPIAVSGVDRDNSPLQEMDVRQALEYTLSHHAVQEAIGQKTTPEAYLADGEAMKLSGRKERQNSIHVAMTKADISMPYRHDTGGLRFGRSDFDSLPRGVHGHHVHDGTIQLMEQHVQAIRPETVSPLTPDPAAQLRRKTHDELLDPNREKRLKQLEQAGILVRQKSSS